MFEPRIVCFFCKWCTYAGADLAGTSRKQYPPNGVVVRVNCSGRIDPQHVLWAFREGADGVLIGGCHPGDCHYQDGNYKTMRRVAFLRRMLEAMGVAPERLHLEWISAAEGDKVVRVLGDFVDQVRDLGPLKLELAGGGKGGAAVRAELAAMKRSAGPVATTPSRKRPSAKKATKKTARKAPVRRARGAGKPAKKVAAKKAAKRAAKKSAAKKTPKRKVAPKSAKKSGAAKKPVAKKPVRRAEGRKPGRRKTR